jgi:hypothetical protein
MRNARRANFALAALLPTLWVVGLGSRASAASIGEILDEFCVDCHGKHSTKAGLDLRPLVESMERSPLHALRMVRERLQRADMPPDGEPRPTPEAYAVAWERIDAELRRRESSVSAGRPTLRRLNRVEFRNSVRDLVGVDVDVPSSLPADDVGEGFDHIGDVLSMPPTLLEKYLDVAERVALRAWPDSETSLRREASGDKLALRGGGQVNAQGANVWSAGTAYFECELPRDGTYRVTFRGFGDQAGKEPVKVAIRNERDRLAYFDLPERRKEPGTRSATVVLGGGTQRIGVEFLNDFYDESKPQGDRDRNLHVISIALEGPIDQVAPTAAVARLAGPSPTLRAFLGELLPRAFRHPVDEESVIAFEDRVLAAAGDATAWSSLARIAITATLVDPRFLFHVERDPIAGAADRSLDGHEIAARLSSFLWRTLPDEALRASALDGSLNTVEGAVAAADRLLDDPRSIALAEHFGQQWLFIRGVEERMPDPTLFEGVDGALLADMKAETTLFLDAMLREERPLAELMTADWSFLNARLARHYGIDGVDGDWLRRVRLADRRVPGLLGHGSVLVATSNPTRTSPVKRGKWVLEAILDAAPPPPPPGVPQLPENGHDGARASVRELLARHRADPACAGCHRRMDAIGLALEPLDAVGRARTRDGEELIEPKGDLPDGRHFEGPRELAVLLANDPATIRSVARHLTVYALGRALRDEDQLIVDAIVRGLPPSPTFRDLIRAIVRSDQFRKRSAPPALAAAPEEMHP